MINIDNNGNYSYGFIDGHPLPDIYFSFQSIPSDYKDQIKVGTEVAFKIMNGKKKDEAYEIEVA